MPWYLWTEGRERHRSALGSRVGEPGRFSSTSFLLPSRSISLRDTDLLKGSDREVTFDPHLHP